MQPDEACLRDVASDDLLVFFEHQRDPEANQMASFPPRELDAFMEHWSKIACDESAIAMTVVVSGHVAGNVMSWKRDGRRAVGYWIGREYWGQGVASRALAEFLRIVTERPLHAHVAKQNLASLRVLEKCGFTMVGEAKVPFGAPGEEIAEYLMTLT